MPAPALHPKHRRAALAALSRDCLTNISTQYELEVGDRRVASNHVDAIVRSRRIDFAELRGRLSRDELKTICGALELPNDGREKQVLIDRILALGDAATPLAPDVEAAKTNGRSSRPPGEAQTALDFDPAQKLTREQLESYLWAAADILRGSIDSSDYKNFSFGLLFLKRLSDRFEEECEQLVAEGADPQDPDEHQFFVPKRARWSSIQKAVTGLGEVLNKASGLDSENVFLSRGDILFNRTNSIDNVGKVALIPTPPIDEQREITQAIDAAAQRIQTERAAVASTKAMKGALTSVLLTGELRVIPDEDSA
jgi:type I restriction enzyme M protein